MPDDQPMSQEDIDRLLAGMLDGGGTEPAGATTPAAPAPLTIDQGELDALVAALEQPSGAAPSPTEVDQGELDRLLAHLDSDSASDARPVAETPAPTSDGPLGQNEIDRILENLDAPAPAAAAPTRPAPVPAATADGPLGQDSIDALLASMDSAPAAPPPPTAAAPPPAAPPGGPMGQDDIDALLNSLGDAPAPAAAAAPALLPPAATLGGTGKTGAASKGAAAVPGGKLDQDGIDALLNEFGATESRVGAAKIGSTSRGSKAGIPAAAVPAAPGTTSRGHLALSTEDLTALVSKHAPAADAGQGEGMIDQTDIDALVKQLGAASATLETPAPTMSQELAKHDAAIDQLLGEGKPAAAGAVTMDAIDPRLVLEKSPSTTANQRPGAAYTVNVPVLTPPELRGARWLLAAAVLLLAICAGTLVVVAGAVRTLGGELARERAANLEPGDDYGTDFAAAVGRLSAPDEDQVATGVLFLQRLKKRYPSHDAEIALVLARHFRGHGAWREAAREYAAVIDDPVAVGDDPRVLLESADTLHNLKDHGGARRQLYALLAEEARWTGPGDPPRPSAMVERNTRALVEAHLLLARLLDDPEAGPVARVEQPPAEHGAHGATAEPAAHDGHSPETGGHDSHHAVGGGHE